jgi:hypothetical protein
MELPPFVVSVFGAVVAAATGYFTYRQAKATHLQAKIARKIFKSAQAPRFEGVLTYVGSAGHRLQLQLDSLKPLLELEARIVNGSDAQFIDVADNCDPYIARHGRIDGGGSIYWWVRVKYPYPQELRLEVSCKGKGRGDKWVVGVGGSSGSGRGAERDH